MSVCMRGVGVRHEPEVSHFAENNADIIISLQISESVYHSFVVFVRRLRGSVLELCCKEAEVRLVFTASQLSDPTREVYLS